MADRLAPFVVMAELLDSAPGVLVCVKHLDGTYVAVNQAFVDRTSATSRRQVIGRTAAELFPLELAARYEQQDADVVERHRPLRDELELITRADGGLGWYLTTKLPVHDDSGRCIGIATASVDLGRVGDPDDPEVAALATVVRLVHGHLADPLTVDELAVAAGLSNAQLERRMRRVLGVSAKQYIVKARVEEAARRLVSSTQTLADIAHGCGWYDQSAFTRQFARVVGCTPGEYRARSARA